jgi:hypothetical protein
MRHCRVASWWHLFVQVLTDEAATHDSGISYLHDAVVVFYHGATSFFLSGDHDGPEHTDDGSASLPAWRWWVSQRDESR